VLRRSSLYFALVLLVALTLLTPLQARSGASQPTSAGALLTQSLDAAQASGSVHFVDKTKVNGSVQTLEGAVSAPTSGEELSGSAPLDIELISDNVYVEGSTGALVQALAISAAQAAPYGGKWIDVHPSDAPFQLLVTDLTLNATLTDFTPQARGLKLGSVQRVGKIKVIPVEGTPSDLPKGSSGSVALLVSTKAPHLPIGGTLVVANKTGRLTEAAIFNSWGAKVQLTPPSSSVPFSSLLT
jgi:hypothetical protein